MATCTICFATIGIKTPTYFYDKEQSPTKEKPVGITLTFLLFLFIFFYKPTWGATTWIWIAEIFSMNVCAQVTGMSWQMQNVANTIFQQFFPTFLAKCGFHTFYFFAGINICLAIFVFFFVPKTHPVSIEEMDVLFGWLQPR